MLRRTKKQWRWLVAGSFPRDGSFGTVTAWWLNSLPAAEVSILDQAITVMLVVSSPLERTELRTLIEAHGTMRVVAEAADGDAALALGQDTRPSIAVIDHSLPDTPALGLAHLMGVKLLDTSILLYTDLNNADDIVAAISDGVRTFVLKSRVQQHLLPALEALADGRPYWEDAVDDEVLDELLESAARPPPSNLSDREWQILQGAAEGRTNKEMAQSLSISAETVGTHRLSMRRKLGFRNHADLVRYAALERMVDTHPDSRGS